MTWIFVAVGVAFAGLVVLLVLSARVMIAARALSREIAHASAQIAPAERTLRQRIGANGASKG